jgi:hypothetical protein
MIGFVGKVDQVDIVRNPDVAADHDLFSRPELGALAYIGRITDLDVSTVRKNKQLTPYMRVNANSDFRFVMLHVDYGSLPIKSTAAPYRCG